MIYNNSSEKEPYKLRRRGFYLADRSTGQSVNRVLMVHYVCEAAYSGEPCTCKPQGEPTPKVSPARRSRARRGSNSSSVHLPSSSSSLEGTPSYNLSANSQSPNRQQLQYKTPPILGGTDHTFAAGVAREPIAVPRRVLSFQLSSPTVQNDSPHHLDSPSRAVKKRKSFSEPCQMDIASGIHPSHVAGTPSRSLLNPTNTMFTSSSTMRTSPLDDAPPAILLSMTPTVGPSSGGTPVRLVVENGEPKQIYFGPHPVDFERVPEQPSSNEAASSSSIACDSAGVLTYICRTPPASIDRNIYVTIIWANNKQASVSRQFFYRDSRSVSSPDTMGMCLSPASSMREVTPRARGSTAGHLFATHMSHVTDPSDEWVLQFQEVLKSIEELCCRYVESNGLPIPPANESSTFLDISSLVDVAAAYPGAGPVEAGAIVVLRRIRDRFESLAPHVWIFILNAAKSNGHGNTILHIASVLGYTTLVSLLLDSGMSKTETNVDGKQAHELVRNHMRGDTNRMMYLLCGEVMGSASSSSSHRAASPGTNLFSSTMGGDTDGEGPSSSNSSFFMNLPNWEDGQGGNGLEQSILQDKATMDLLSELMSRISMLTSLDEATVKLQAFARGCLARRRLRIKKEVVARLETQFVTKQLSREFQAKRTIARKLQQKFRTNRRGDSIGGGMDVMSRPSRRRSPHLSGNTLIGGNSTTPSENDETHLHSRGPHLFSSSAPLSIDTSLPPPPEELMGDDGDNDPNGSFSSSFNPPASPSHLLLGDDDTLMF